MAEAVVRTEGLTVVFNHRLRAVDGVNIEVDGGEVFGLLGPNGAGKTTTLKVLTTLLRPTQGDAWVEGHHVVEEPNKVRKSIGYVTQEVTVEDHLTAWENLLYYAKLHDVPRGRRDSRIREVLELMDLEARATDLVKTFSGGMKRRLEVAGALVHEPRVLFLDEPSLGLDPQTRTYLWSHLLRLKEGGTTIFLTTHYMEEASHLCDRVCIIDLGRVVALGPPAELRAHVGGDVVTLVVQGQVEEALSALEGMGPRAEGEEVRVTVARGEEELPRILAALGSRSISVKSVHMDRASLDDVFLKFTGRRLREEEDRGRPSGIRRIRTAMRARR